MKERASREKAREEAITLKKNGWLPSVTRFRSSIRDIIEEDREMYVKMVNEEYEKL